MLWLYRENPEISNGGVNGRFQTVNGNQTHAIESVELPSR